MRWDWLAGGVTRHAYYSRVTSAGLVSYQDCNALDAHAKNPSFFFFAPMWTFTNIVCFEIWKQIARSLGAHLMAILQCARALLSQTRSYCYAFFTHLATGNLTLNSRQHHRKRTNRGQIKIQPKDENKRLLFILPASVRI